MTIPRTKDVAAFDAANVPILKEILDKIQRMAATNAELDVVAGGGVPPASFVVLGLDGTLTAERVLTAGTGVTIQDNGANSTVVISSTGVPGGSDTHVQYNNAGAFGGNSGFRYVSNTSVNIKKDMKMVFDDDESANTYWIYNSSNDYMELYLDGDLRAQF